MNENALKKLKREVKKKNLKKKLKQSGENKWRERKWYRFI
jgi:hypothetical protein